MTLFGKFFAFLGSLLISAEHMAKNIYNSLPAADQEALQHGTGFLAVVNTMLDAAPGEVRKAFSEHYPTVDETPLEKNVFDLAKSFGLTADGSLDDVIVKIQEHLKNAPQGKFWEAVTTGFSLALALAFGGPEAKTEVYLQVIRYVYTYIVRPKILKTDVPVIPAETKQAA